MSDEWNDEAVRVSDLFVAILYKTLSQHLVAQLTESKVSLPQIQAMRYIWLHDHVLIGDLADGLSISYPSATNMVNRLEKQGFVARIVNPSDRREVEVKLSVRGRSLTEQIEEERVVRLRKVLADMPVDDKDALLRGLYSFICTAVGGDESNAREICLRCGSKASDSCPVAHEHILSKCQ